MIVGFLTLSKSDAIQQRAANASKLALFIEMLDQYPITLDILWAFSFNHDIQQQLRDNAPFMAKLGHLAKNSDNEQMRKATHGILWNLESIHQDRPTPDIDDQRMFDIMISYSHKDQILCKQIYEHLVQAGYRVWIDFDQMHGNVMDAMAQAIERSHIIVICMSEQYRRSNYCRAEAHYAFQRGLKLVPVLLQEHYQPDGWLLFLIGQILYVDFTKYDFQQSMRLLIRELRAENHVEMNVTTFRPRSNTRATLINLIDDELDRPKKIQHWGKAHVQQWLLSNGLMQMARLLGECDGQALIYFNDFLNNSEHTDILMLLQDDCLRRTKESLSVIELSSLRSLIDHEQNRGSRPSRKRRHIHLARDQKYFKACCSLM